MRFPSDGRPEVGLGESCIAVCKHALLDWARVAAAWERLVSESPYGSFFLRREWVEAWLETYGPTLDLDILTFHAGRDCVGACLLVRRTVYHKLIPVRTVYLNTAGEDDEDSPCVEFNNLLCLPGWERPVAVALRSHMDRTPWDELRVNGFCEGEPLEALLEAFGDMRIACKKKTLSYFVDLETVRESGKPFESMLGAKDRARLRQNFRHYGELETEIAADEKRAFAMLDELSGLSIGSWAKRGRVSAFASGLFTTFHRRLVKKAFCSGSIQMVRVASGGTVVGLLYNTIHRREVYYYQSGFNYDESKRVRPGFVTLACGIVRCLEIPCLKRFNFMTGTNHYKEPLSNGAEPIAWVAIQKRNSRVVSACALKKLWSGLRAIRHALPKRPDRAD